MRQRGATAETLTDGPTLTAKGAARGEELNDLWSAPKQAEPAKHGTMAWLIKSYEQSSWYTDLGKRTRENVDLALREINAALGPFPAAAVGRRDCRTCYEGVLASRGPNAAKTAHTYLRRLFSWAQEIELRTDNPAKGMQIKSASPRRQTWEPEQVAEVVKTALDLGRRDIALFVLMGYDTGQRLSDLMTIKWDAYDGEGLTFFQGKTDQEVWVPLEPETKQMIDDTPRQAVQIIVSPETDQPHTNRAVVNRHFRRVAKAAGIPNGVQMRDLRRTAATEISAGGGKIHPITGHAPGSSMERVYVVPNKEAARTSKRARNKNKV